jgi:ABC-type Fe3+/spermidine/putrescine transport system ATPase subunit
MVTIEALSLQLGAFFLKEFNLSLREQEHFVLLGPTASGKTTLLRCLLGFQRVSCGRFLLRDRDLLREEPHLRNLGFLPQEYALFPHLSVRKNITFGPAVRGLTQEETACRLQDLAAVLEIHHLLERSVEGLSGGEKQRVALARALIVEPDLLLLDEPFSAIDTGLRERLWVDMKTLLRRLGTTVLHVTHNLGEAAAMGDRVGLLIEGNLEQVGPVEEVFMQPATEKAARYLGIKNIFEGVVVSQDEGQVSFQVPETDVRIVAPRRRPWENNQHARVAVRPQDIKILKEGIPVREDLSENVFEGEITSLYTCNDFTTLTLSSALPLEMRVPVYIAKRCQLQPGKRIRVAIWQGNILTYPSEPERACSDL